MTPNAGDTLFVANSDADSVSVIDTNDGSEIERIDVRLAEDAFAGASPEGVVLSEDERRCMSPMPTATRRCGCAFRKARGGNAAEKMVKPRSQKYGIIPTGQYPSAVAGQTANSSSEMERNGIRTFVDAREQQRAHSESTQPAFPPNKEKNRQAGNTAGRLFRETSHRFASGRASIIALHAATLQNDGLMGLRPRNCLPGRAPSNTWSTSSRRIARTTGFW